MVLSSFATIWLIRLPSLTFKPTNDGCRVKKGKEVAMYKFARLKTTGGPYIMVNEAHKKGRK